MKKHSLVSIDAGCVFCYIFIVNLVIVYLSKIDYFPLSVEPT